jgi:hypothetical protein
MLNFVSKVKANTFTRENMRSGLIRLLFILIWVIISCDNEEESQILITGTARYYETNLVAENIPIKLIIYNSDDPYRLNLLNKILTKEVITDKEGQYNFSFDRAILNQNSAYQLFIGTDSLVITSELTPGCRPASSATGVFYTSNTITRNLKIDYPSFLQITFDKLDNSTSDRVRLLRKICILFESTLEKADTTILETMHFHMANTVDMQYEILKDNGVTIDNTMIDVHLLKNDTIKLTIEY